MLTKKHYALLKQIEIEEARKLDRLKKLSKWFPLPFLVKRREQQYQHCLHLQTISYFVINDLCKSGEINK